MGFISFLCRQLFIHPGPAPPSTDLTSKTLLITGANTGLGLEATRQLIALNISRVILGVRTLSKGEAAFQDLLSTHPNCIIEIWELNMENFDSVSAFGERAKGLDRLDFVLLNAGVSKTEFGRAGSGHEMTVQVNHLSTALLSLMLLGPLKATAKLSGGASRLTITSSEVGMWAKFEERTASNVLKRLDEEESWPSGSERYDASKALNILWARELASKIDASEVVVNTVNPGLCHSRLHRDDPSAALRVFKRIFARSATEGGYCLVDAVAVQGSSSHGKFLSEQKITSLSGVPGSGEASDLQRKLWKETLEIIRNEVPGVELDQRFSAY